jgi:hypothetical protein
MEPPPSSSGLTVLGFIRPHINWGKSKNLRKVKIAWNRPLGNYIIFLISLKLRHQG